MADLTHLFTGGYKAERPAPLAPPEQQLMDAIAASGLTPPDHVVMDGRIHRFSGDGKKGKSAWYVAFMDGVPAGSFGDWKLDSTVTWRADVARELTPVEEMAIAARMAEARKRRDEERQKREEVADKVVDEIWRNAIPADDAHPYLARKGVKPHGARTTGDGRLIVPLYDNQTGDLSSLQYIAADGSKQYHGGARTKDCSWMVGTTDDATTVYIAEGFATAATIHETMGQPCVVAYSASGLVPAAGMVRERFPKLEAVVVADNDTNGVGQMHADQAAAKYGVRVVTIPQIDGQPTDANDYRATGLDLSVILAPPEADDWLMPADDFSAKPAPIQWLVKGWLQSHALIMVHGESGCGKTFVVLDLCCHISSGLMAWHGRKVRAGKVVYLAGEGHAGLRGRVAAWKQYHKMPAGNMWVSSSGLDLNTSEGLARTVRSIRATGQAPDLIVVDTLHRFLMGDENSAQDAKTMLDACAALMREFDCSVLLVHHVGVNPMAKDRARGSSAWRGALEIEIGVRQEKDSTVRQLVQHKSKDAEIAMPTWVDFKAVEIDGWLDDDGEQVTSAVVVPADAPKMTKEQEARQADERTLYDAWVASGRPYTMTDTAERVPLITREAMTEHFERMGKKTSSIAKELQANSGRFINRCIDRETVISRQNDWILVDNALRLAWSGRAEINGF